MCRLPVDIMTMIVKLLHQPLPEHGDESVTWEQLHQHDLTKMMRVSRMTYAITAPLLYREVVVNNLSAFLHGVDDVQREYHTKFEVRPGYEPGQTHICRFVTRAPQDNEHAGVSTIAYACPRHHPTAEAGLYHKHELIGMVQALHLVYSYLDETVYHTVAEASSEEEEAKAIEELYSFKELKHYLSGSNDIILGLCRDLQRMTIGSWREAAWNGRYGSLVMDFERNWDRSYDLESVEADLAFKAPDLVANHICRSVFEGPLARYPVFCVLPLPASDLTLHNPKLSRIGPSLALGTENIIHVPRPKAASGFTSAFEYVLDEADLIAQEIAQAQTRWNDLNDDDDDDNDDDDESMDDGSLFFTSITFYLEKTRGECYRDLALDREPDSQEALNLAEWALHRELESLDPAIADHWVGKIDFKWADDAGNCKACGRSFTKPSPDSPDQFKASVIQA